MRLKNISTNEITVQQKQLTNCFPSAFLTTSFGTPLNCLNGVMLPHILFSTILHRSKAAFAGTAHPRFKQMSKIALRILPASPLDCRQMRETDQKNNLPSSRLLDEHHICHKCELIKLNCEISPVIAHFSLPPALQYPP